MGNFAFTSGDGWVCEVDLLAFGKGGLRLIEPNHWHGSIRVTARRCGAPPAQRLPDAAPGLASHYAPTHAMHEWDRRLSLPPPQPFDDLIASKAVRLNAIGPYYTMFPLEFPLDALAKATEGWVLDPFCGRGTTLFAARLRRLPSVGVDISPVAAAFAAAKHASGLVEDVIEFASSLMADTPAVGPPQGEFWDLAYHPETLEQLTTLRSALLDEEGQIATLTRALLLGILHGPRNKGAPSYLSNQMPRTYATKPASAVRFWKSRGLLPPAVRVVDVLRRRAEWVLAALPPKGEGFAVSGDCREVLPSLEPKFSWIVTSPPYLGMRTYIPDQWLRSWFLGGPPNVEYVADGQIGRWASERFVSELATCWRSVAESSTDGAVLIVRFGALPSLHVDPREILIDSLRGSGMPWNVLGSAPAGVPPRQARQATQFAHAGKVVEEIDLIARLG